MARFAFDVEDHLAVRNPIASELTHLRRSLLPGLFDNLLSNVRHSQDFRLFEIGREIHAGAKASFRPNEFAPLGASYSLHGTGEDFFEVKRAAECLFPGARSVRRPCALTSIRIARLSFSSRIAASVVSSNFIPRCCMRRASRAARWSSISTVELARLLTAAVPKTYPRAQKIPFQRLRSLGGSRAATPVGADRGSADKAPANPISYSSSSSGNMPALRWPKDRRAFPIISKSAPSTILWLLRK